MRGIVVPGRWVGGAVGAMVCLGLALVGQATEADGPFLGPYSLVSLVILALLGLPIAILAGRALLPAARSGGWGTALGIGLVFGLLAPPLGAIEIVAGLLISATVRGSVYSPSPLAWLVQVPASLIIAMAYSFVVVWVTVPCGLVWALIVRAIPESALLRLQVPRPLQRLGARHFVLVAVLVWIAATVRAYLG